MTKSGLKTIQTFILMQIMFRIKNNYITSAAFSILFTCPSDS